MLNWFYTCLIANFMLCCSWSATERTCTRWVLASWLNSSLTSRIALYPMKRKLLRNTISRWRWICPEAVVSAAWSPTAPPYSSSSLRLINHLTGIVIVQPFIERKHSKILADEYWEYSQLAWCRVSLYCHIQYYIYTYNIHINIYTIISIILMCSVCMIIYCPYTWWVKENCILVIQSFSFSHWFLGVVQLNNIHENSSKRFFG